MPNSDTRQQAKVIAEPKGKIESHPEVIELIVRAFEYVRPNLENSNEVELGSKHEFKIKSGIVPEELLKELAALNMKLYGQSILPSETLKPSLGQGFSTPLKEPFEDSVSLYSPGKNWNLFGASRNIDTTSHSQIDPALAQRENGMSLIALNMCLLFNGKNPFSEFSNAINNIRDDSGVLSLSMRTGLAVRENRVEAAMASVGLVEESRLLSHAATFPA